jgi:hypothetical protein
VISWVKFCKVFHIGADPCIVNVSFLVRGLPFRISKTSSLLDNVERGAVAYKSVCITHLLCLRAFSHWALIRLRPCIIRSYIRYSAKTVRYSVTSKTRFEVLITSCLKRPTVHFCDISKSVCGTGRRIIWNRNESTMRKIALRASSSRTRTRGLSVRGRHLAVP